jgi:pyridoxal phosphate enzyme (YggS family)
MTILENYKKIISDLNKHNNKVTLIVVSKTFSLDFIKPLIDFGHKHYGENKVQEAINKWSEIIKTVPDIEIHLVGKLQTNKAKDAVKIFSYIHSLDNEKLANQLASEEKKSGMNLKYFIQVNVGDEPQKSGISIKDSDDFINYCVNHLKLNVVGLMCIPPVNQSPDKYFLKLKELADKHKLSELSMGMSHDYKEAINCGASFVRIGSLIFGDRK